MQSYSSIPCMYVYIPRYSDYPIIGCPGEEYAGDAVVFFYSLYVRVYPSLQRLSDYRVPWRRVTEVMQSYSSIPCMYVYIPRYSDYPIIGCPGEEYAGDAVVFFYSLYVRVYPSLQRLSDYRVPWRRVRR